MMEDAPKSPESNEEGVDDRRLSEKATKTSKNNGEEKQDEVKSPDEPKGPKSQEDEHVKDERNSHRGMISLSICRQISYITQFLVIVFAVGAFSFAAYSSIRRLQSRHILESRESVSQDDAWFKLAICLRPFMTPSELEDFYHSHLKMSIQTHMAGLSKHTTWDEKTWLDVTLQAENYAKYFREVHPWEKIPVRRLWTYQNKTFRKAFKEFQLNNVRLTPRVSGSSTGANKDKSGYTALKRKTTQNSGKINYSLLGAFSLSPIYAGCLNITINESMSKRQMEINVKLKNSFASKYVDTDGNHKRIVLFEAADLFVYDANDVFTEIPIIQKLSKFSVHSHSLERFLVKGSSYRRKNTENHHCSNHTGYSQTNCRQWCITRKLLESIECILPWMQDLIQKPWLDEKFRNLALCSNYDTFSKTLAIQQKYLQSSEANMTRPVADCLDSCPPRCSTIKVSILSLGSKMIDSDYGISLTISPEMDTITEELDYVLMNLVAELSASISFLLGLSAIAIYDWLVAFGVWSAIKLGLFRDAAGEDDEPGAHDAEEAPTPSIVPRLQVQSEEGDVSPSLAPPGNDNNASLIWYVEPSARKGGNQVAPLESAGVQPQSSNNLSLPRDDSLLATLSPSMESATEHSTPANASPQPDPTA